MLARQLEHGRAIRQERERAARDGETPDFARLMKAWGGSQIVYRRSMEESPAYRLNHEEIVKALEEGIGFVENLEPVEALPDENGALRAVVFRRKDGSTVELPCRTLLVAAGTSPNVTYGRERPGSIPLDAKNKFFRPHVAEKDGALFRVVPKDDGIGAFFTGTVYQGKLLSYFGDNHPVYAGSVVKAMASARDGTPKIRELFADALSALDGTPAAQESRDDAWRSFGAMLDDLLVPRVVRVDRLTPTIVDVIVRAPMAARNFRPGQFFRFQNYEAFAARLPDANGGPGTPALIEPCALTGASVDREKGLLSMIALELGVSSRLCALLKEGEPVVVMGPTGTPTQLPENETVVLCGGGLGNAVLFSIGRAARERGNKVLYFAGYRKAEDFYKREEIEAAADVVVWAVDVAPAIPARRPQDFTFLGDIVQAMLAYAEGRLGKTTIALGEASRLIAIGSDRMMAAVAAARHGVLAPHLSAAHEGIGSINSPMQCMMKEVCAQCLQRHVDPVTKKESFVFSCFNQDQRLDEMDWENLRARLSQNSLEERLSNQWLDLRHPGRGQDRAEDEVGIHDERAPRCVLVAEDREVQVRPADDVARRADFAEALPLRDVVTGLEAFLVALEVRVEERVLRGRVAQVHDLPASFVAAEALDDSIRDGHDRRPARRGQVDRMVLLVPAAPGEERVAELRAVERLERQREIRREELRELALGDRDRTAVRLAHDEARERLREVLPEREMRRVHRRLRAVPRVVGVVGIVRILLGDVGALHEEGLRIRGTREPREIRRVGRRVAAPVFRVARRTRLGERVRARRGARRGVLPGGGSRLEEHRDRGCRGRVAPGAQRSAQDGREKEAQETRSR